MPSPIRFNYADRTPSIPHKNKLKSFIVQLFEEEQKSITQIDYIFCSDQFLLQINKDHLQHDYYTDIITFPLSDKDEPIEGEIYISIDRVKENAQSHSTDIIEETLRVIFHGCLHLCGYKDKKKEEVLVMRQKEDYYIAKFLAK